MKSEFLILHIALIESEMKLVVLLFSNSITLAEFRSRLCEIQPDGVLREELLCAVTQIYTGTTSRMVISLSLS